MAPGLSRSVELLNVIFRLADMTGRSETRTLTTELPTNPPSFRLFWGCGCNGDIPWSGRAEGFIPLRADGAKE